MTRLGAPRLRFEVHTGVSPPLACGQCAHPCVGAPLSRREALVAASLGGSTALLRGVAAFDELKLQGDQAVGVLIVKRTLEERGRGRGHAHRAAERGVDPVHWRRNSGQVYSASPMKWWSDNPSHRSWLMLA